MKTCGAKTRSGIGPPCKRPAGWGTDHPGEGRCRSHGGRTPRGVESPHFKHGGRSKHFDPSDLVGFDEWEQEIGPTLSFERRLMGMMFVLEQWVYRGVIETKAGDTKTLEPTAVASMCNAVTRAYQAITKRHEGETVYVKLAQPQVEAAFRAMGEAVARHVSDPNEAEALRADLEAALEKIAEGES
jgi:hypothetical protein